MCSHFGAEGLYMLIRVRKQITSTTRPLSLENPGLVTMKSKSAHPELVEGCADGQNKVSPMRVS